ncbi:hypothetical protein M8A51_25680 [Schlegelella sp. S2-27]|uniref:Uncharacterized protein n=1 Tax=Caldimonas mangrovi TaxID=2944811 RepID=A0ABT0YVZ5_9BURK|nr:hypothetical protein [Caldimonas mangrovi]MCM5682928.1 hypothetical protein [Caldimonas mangrovi]
MSEQAKALDIAARLEGCAPVDIDDVFLPAVAELRRLHEVNAELLEVCTNARDMLATDRQAFVDSQQVRGMRAEEPIAHGLVWVEDGVWIDSDVAEALHDYDRAIALIDSAVARALGQSKGE